MAVDMVAGAVKKILDAVVGGTFVEEEPLPAEAELARFLNVSRPTMREAVRTLALGGVLNVVHGRGTFLLPRFRWSELRGARGQCRRGGGRGAGRRGDD